MEPNNTVIEETGYETTGVEQQGGGATPIEQAFLQSENHEFDGVKLEPYSPMRIVAGQAMGLHHGRVDDGGMEQFSRILVYPGAIRDVCIVLWLCSIKDERQIDQAARAPIHAAKLAVDWGMSHGLMDSGSDKFVKAFGLFMKIMREVKESYGTPQKKIPAETKPPESQI